MSEMRARVFAVHRSVFRVRTTVRRAGHHHVWDAYAGLHLRAIRTHGVLPTSRRKPVRGATMTGEDTRKLVEECAGPLLDRLEELAVWLDDNAPMVVA